jgi:phospholipid transport system transporter-binding protein
MSNAFELRADGAGRLRASGQLGLETAIGALGAGLAALPKGGECLIDLREVSDVDSAGLAVLIEWLAQARARGTRLVYTNLPPALRSLAKLSGVEFLFPELPAPQSPAAAPSPA